MASTTYDPFTWRIAELGSCEDPERRLLLENDLLIAEAEELAQGRRHVTIVHGEPRDLAESSEFDALYDVLFGIAERSGWHRIRGSRSWVTVTLAGEGRDATLLEIEHLAACHQWNAMESAIPAR